MLRCIVEVTVPLAGFPANCWIESGRRRSYTLEPSHICGEATSPTRIGVLHIACCQLTVLRKPQSKRLYYRQAKRHCVEVARIAEIVKASESDRCVVCVVEVVAEDVGGIHIVLMYIPLTRRVDSTLMLFGINVYEILRR